MLVESLDQNLNKSNTVHYASVQKVVQKCPPQRKKRPSACMTIPCYRLHLTRVCAVLPSRAGDGDVDMRRAEQRQWRAISCSLISCYQRVGDSCGYSRVGVSIDPQDTMSTAPVLWTRTFAAIRPSMGQLLLLGVCRGGGRAFAVLISRDQNLRNAYLSRVALKHLSQLTTKYFLHFGPKTASYYNSNKSRIGVQ